MAHYLVTLGRGSAWDPARDRRAQPGWDEHAAFMDQLAERGMVLLGGPVGDDVDAGDALLVVSAEDQAAVRALLAADPWHDSILTINSVQRWTVWVAAPGSVDSQYLPPPRQCAPPLQDRAARRPPPTSGSSRSGPTGVAPDIAHPAARV
jgi:uncharacterized protein YciI